MLKKVLCIDDDSIALTISQLLLKHTGFSEEVITAIDGMDALEYYEQLQANLGEVYPELILLDINMPIMNGWEFLEAFKLQYQNVFPNTQIILLSSTIDPEDFANAKKYPAVVQFISKPLSVENIALIKENPRIAAYFS